MLCVSIPRVLAWLLLSGLLAACNDVAETAATGTIKISVQDWSGVEGYRFLAVVWSESGEGGGGAFWTLIDSDPFSGEDVVHPMFWGEDVEEVDVEDWGAGDYLWEETARLEPGTYRIDFFANPGNLAPYGSHIPAGSVERQCWVEAEVRAGEESLVVISGIPNWVVKGAYQCPPVG